MKRILIFVAIIAIALMAYFIYPYGKCTPSDKGTCTACSSCKSCKNCSVDKGKCSVCK